ncbi:programmed cell death protein 2 isoform X4 [Protopterus annectens]|uniref:programmed cell death protein 2 isoform X4 n=1 Tax=Protopterus annectens TaxID=7888 RepID=UPI001CFA6DC7|nr:programmed cell death protein 2 isoform X4 [Protopterus annectens]
MAGVTRDSSVVQFGFVEEAVEWRLRSSQFPSKVGGKPSWLSLCELPGPEELSCELCGQPCVFLLQVYAPVPEKADCFHRTVFVFCCRNVACYSFNDRRSFKGGSKETGVSTFLFPENELVVEPEEMQPATDPEREPESSTEPAAQLAVDNITVPDFASNCLDEKELEAMAKSESEEDKVFQHFKQRIAIEPEQVLRYSRGGSPLWVSAKNVPQQESIPHCICGAERIFEFQVMPQLLNHLNVDTLDTSIDWGTLAVYTCAESCDTDNKYVPEFLWKQDYSH